MNQRAGSFEENQQCRFSTSSINQKGRKLRINRIRDEKRNVTMDHSGIHRKIKNDYKQLHTNKSENLEEMDCFLDTDNLRNWVNYKSNRSMAKMEIESVMKSIPIKKSPVSRTYHSPPQVIKKQ